MACHAGRGKPGRLGRWRNRVLLTLMATTFLAGVSGCTRHFFRKRADKEVEQVLPEKDRDPNWRVEQWHVYPNPRARFADPTNPDRPPMPPDDPAAWDLSPHPQKPGECGTARIEGTGYLDLLAAWDAENRSSKETSDSKTNIPPIDKEEKSATTAKEDTLSSSERPESRPYTRPFLITVKQAVELGLINSREYQDRREDLYLTALPVTLERFAFASQFFATEQILREWTGRRTTTGQRNEWAFNTTGGFSKLFSTGALLLFQFANQTVINLSGPNARDATSQSTLSLDLVQPLLRGGGRAVTLEPLTQVERNLLYEVRDYAHFRKDFFTYMVGGVDFTRGTLITPSALSRAVLPATAGGGGGVGVGAIRPQVSPGAAGRLGAILPGTAPSAGYLPTLLFGGQLAIDRQNVTALEGFLKLFEAIKEGGDISQLQVDNVESQLLSGRTAVSADNVNYQNSLDQLKLQLGVPTDLSLELDDAPLRPITDQFARFRAVLDEFQAAQEEASKNDKPGLRARLRQLFLDSAVVQGTAFRSEFPRRWAVWEKLSADELVKLLAKYRAERRDLLGRKAELEKKEQTLSSPDQQRLAVVDNEIDLGAFESQLRRFESEPWKGETSAERRQRLQSGVFRDVVNIFSVVLGGARNERLDLVRQRWPQLPPVCIDGVNLLHNELEDAQTVVAQTALTNRLDLMNQRAQLVDAWRQVAVAANALLGVVNLQYHLDSTTPAGQAKPLAVGGSRTTHQIITNFQLPLVRKSERNAYRSTLIAYQRQRRALMAEEDLVLNTVRTELRQLRQLAEDYTIQKRAVEIAYYQVENSLDTFRQPPTPSPTSGGNVQANAAALTQQLLSAQSTLQRAQNQMLMFWVNYQIARMQLYADLELMPLDNRGVWIDDVATCQCSPADPDRSPGIGQPNLSGSGRLQREDSGPREKLPTAGSPALE